MAKHENPVIEPPLTQRDDLKLIHGIGPGIEKRLNAAGIQSYGQLASMTPAEVVSSIGEIIGLTENRIEDQDWIGQAKKLQPEKPSRLTNGRNGHQHYATFTVEFLLDEANSVRLTRIVYIQGETDQTWAGWNSQRLCNTIRQNAGLNIPVSERTAVLDKVNPEEDKETVLASSKARTRLVEITGTPQLKETSITSLGTNHSGRIQAADQPLEINLSIDPAGMLIPEASDVVYSAIVDVKELGTHSHVILGEAKGILKQGHKWNLVVKCPGLKEGIYRLKIDLSLRLAEEGQSHTPQISTNFDGGLLRVY
jgi:hypothetical protein